MSHEHEYHFLNKFALWFYALAVHTGRIGNKYKERSEIVKYSKQRQNGANFEHLHCMRVCGVREKFELENVNFFWKIRREQSQYIHRRCNALGESVPCVVRISSPGDTYAWLSANLTNADGRYSCGGGTVSWAFRWELKAECSRRRGSAPWASPSPRARPRALGEERLHWELELWLSAKLLAHGEDSVSGSGTSNKRAAAYYFCLPPPLLPSSNLSPLFLIWSDLAELDADVLTAAGFLAYRRCCGEGFVRLLVEGRGRPAGQLIIPAGTHIMCIQCMAQQSLCVTTVYTFSHFDAGGWRCRYVAGVCSLYGLEKINDNACVVAISQEWRPFPTGHDIKRKVIQS
jgi:hypothetical protein